MLDPEAEWAALRAHAHALSTRRSTGWKCARGPRVDAAPAELKASLQAPLRDGTPIAQVATELAGLLPYGVQRAPALLRLGARRRLPGCVLPELVGAALNANCGGREHAAIYVEKQVLRWARELMGFPADCGALLTTGTSMATVVALRRRATSGWATSAAARAASRRRRSASSATPPPARTRA